MNELLMTGDKVMVIKNRYDMPLNKYLEKEGTIEYVDIYDKSCKVNFGTDTFWFKHSDVCKVEEFIANHQFKVGQFVKGNSFSNTKYNITTELMECAYVHKVNIENEENGYPNIYISIVKHENEDMVGKCFWINSKDVDKIEYNTLDIPVKETIEDENKLIPISDLLSELLPDREILGYARHEYDSDKIYLILKRESGDVIHNDRCDENRFYRGAQSRYRGIVTHNNFYYNSANHSEFLITMEDLHNIGLTICYNCNRLEYYNNTAYCNTCLSSQPKCSVCGKKHIRLFTISNTDEQICDECLTNSDRFYRCHWCNNLYRLDEGEEQPLLTDNGEPLCNECFNRHFRCTGCNRLILEDEDYEGNSNRHIHNHSDYCSSCYERETGNKLHPILSYHEFNAWKLYGEASEIHYGFELEVENIEGNILNDEAANRVMQIMKDKVTCAHDGSIEDGFEIISHPMTYTYMMSIKHELKEMMEYLSSKGFGSHNPGTCGLHFHISRKGLKTNVNSEDETISNILMLFENYKDELTTFSRRRVDDLERWAQFLSTYKNIKNNEVISLDYIKKEKDNRRTRYMALNLTNSKTIEMRLFRGTLNFDTFIATLQLVNNIVTYSKTHSSISGCTWLQLIGNNSKIKEYNKARGIDTKYKKATNILIKMASTRKATRNGEDRREI